MRVSLVVPAWDAERFLGEALDSVEAQTVPPDEVVVVDDGSTDGTAELAATYADRLSALRVLRRPHEGIGASRNAGVAASDGDLVCFLDADDLWLPEKLERQLAALAEQPELDAVFCLIDEFIDPVVGVPPGTRRPKSAVSVALASNALLRRPLVDRLGPFDRSANAEWVGWWATARSQGVHELVVPEVLVRRRLHLANNSAREADDGAGFLAAARAHRRGRRP